MYARALVAGRPRTICSGGLVAKWSIEPRPPAHGSIGLTTEARYSGRPRPTVSATTVSAGSEGRKTPTRKAFGSVDDALADKTKLALKRCSLPKRRPRWATYTARR
jgi:hypothetical protein